VNSLEIRTFFLLYKEIHLYKYWMK